MIPELQVSPELEDPDWLTTDITRVINTNHQKLLKVRERLVDAYHSEFLATLVHQAIDKKDRYKPVPHKQLNVGDIVLLKDKHLKLSTYPMGIVKKVEINSLGEVTAATVLKSKTHELVYRHASSLIQLIPMDSSESKVGNESNLESLSEATQSVGKGKPNNRLAVLESQRKTRSIMNVI